VVAIGDLRISVGTEELLEFGVRKVHSVGPDMIMGFAGSIGVGFAMVDDVRRFYRSDAPAFDTTREFAEAWARDVKGRFSDLVPQGTAGQACHLILAAMCRSPIRGEPTRFMPNGLGVVIKCPQIQGLAPLVARDFWAVGGAASIGSGNAVPALRDMLTELDWLGISKWGTSAQSVLTWIAQHELSANPIRGVSTDVTSMIRLLGAGDQLGSASIAMGPLAEDEMRMATTWDELLQLARRFRPDLAAASLVA
jgi:hypothetical protein